MTVYKSEEGEKEVLLYYKNLLEKWPVDFKEININTSTGNSFIIKSGNNNKPPIILLHGTGSNSASWMNDLISYSVDFSVYSLHFYILS